MIPSRFKKFLQSWVINTLAVVVATLIVRERIHYVTPLDLVVASLGILNAFLRPIMLLLALPLLIFTLGLFMLVINAVLLYFVGWLLPGFQVDGFWAAFWGALIISIVSVLLNILTGSGRTRARFEFRGGRRPPDGPPRGGGGGSGPVIDV
jgi:putative membrane protein